MEESTPRYLHKKKWGWTRLGTHRAFWLNGNLFLTIGPNWGFNILVSSIILIVLFGYFSYLAPIAAPLLHLFAVLILSCSFVSYCLLALLNPGIVIEDQAELGRKYHVTYCQNCMMFVPEKSDHCIHCDVCVINLDHHCPVSGKCIAQGNIAYFYLFLATVFMAFAYLMIFAVAQTTYMQG